jgi:hypothetical protein
MGAAIAKDPGWRRKKDADGMVEILEGLSPGEKVVTSGALFIDRAKQRLSGATSMNAVIAFAPRQRVPRYAPHQGSVGCSPQPPVPALRPQP